MEGLVWGPEEAARLSAAEAEFEAQGGRGVELADEIDGLRARRDQEVHEVEIEVTRRYRMRLVGFTSDGAQAWAERVAQAPEREAHSWDGVEVVDSSTMVGGEAGEAGEVGRAAAPRVVARFVAQVWVNDQSLDVDPQGETEWEASVAFAGLAPGYRAGLLAGMEAHGEALDEADQLHGDAAAPAWVREWGGPFSIYVRLGEAGG
jgi:hypothetical protein